MASLIPIHTSLTSLHSKMSDLLVSYTNTNAHPAVDHNMYVHDNLIYSASYNAGARIFGFVS